MSGRFRIRYRNRRRRAFRARRHAVVMGSYRSTLRTYCGDVVSGVCSFRAEEFLDLKPGQRVSPTIVVKLYEEGL